MGRKKTPGLVKRYGIWRIDKKIYGRRLCESTGTSDLLEAEKYLAYRIEQIRQVTVYGERQPVSFQQAAIRFAEDKTRQGKATLDKDIALIKELNRYIGSLTLDKIHMGTLEPYINAMKKRGCKNATINHGLKVVRQLLRLAASDWRDENGNTWLHAAPRIKLLDLKDAKPPRPAHRNELELLYQELPTHLEAMARFAANTGCRDQEICNLRWAWEYDVPELNTSVFIIPAWIKDPLNNQIKGMVKNRRDRLVVLNEEAMAVIEKQRGIHPTYVFTFKGHPITQMNNSGWQNARKRAGMPDLRVHDLKHTFGMALRAANVSEEDRRDLLGHKSNSITTHYSAVSVQKLIEAANKVCWHDPAKKNQLTFQPKALSSQSREFHAQTDQHQ